MNKDILTELNARKAGILETISRFQDETFNSRPFEGSWTAAQVSEHIYKSVSGVFELLHAGVQKTDRNPGEKTAAIREMFLDFSTKMKSPEFVLPGQAPLKKDKIYTELKTTFEKIADDIQRLDLSLTCTAFELPGFGPFTRAEWIWLGIYHTQRHTRQLQNIFAMVSSHQDALKS